VSKSSLAIFGFTYNNKADTFVEVMKVYIGNCKAKRKNNEAYKKLFFILIKNLKTKKGINVFDLNLRYPNLLPDFTTELVTSLNRLT